MHVQYTNCLFLCNYIVGRQFDKDGIQRMWWTEEVVEAFNDRAQCFVNQYSMYEMFGISVRVTNNLMLLEKNFFLVLAFPLMLLNTIDYI